MSLLLVEKRPFTYQQAFCAIEREGNHIGHAHVGARACF